MTKALAAVIAISLFVLGVEEVKATRHGNEATLLIRADFDRELPLVVAELHATTSERIDEFRREAEASIPEVSAKLGASMGQFDSYLTRVSTKPDELDVAIRQVVGQETDLAFRPMFDRTVDDLIGDEVLARSSLYVSDNEAWKRPLRETYSLRLDGLRDQFFFKNLSQRAGLALKGTDDTAEFVPYVGWVYGGFKLFYDPRLEITIANPAERFFASALHQSLNAAISGLSARYANEEELKAAFRTDWSASKALSRIQVQR